MRKNNSSLKISLVLFGLVYIGNTTLAQTLQQVTNNGSTTTNDITIGAVTSNAASLSGSALPTNISILNGFRINGTVSNAGHNGITYQSGGGGGAAIGFFRGGSYETGIDFYTSGGGPVYGGLIHRMRIANNGYVGIGTSAPLNKLHVNGGIRWGGDTEDYVYTGEDGAGAYLAQVGSTAAKSRLRFQTSKSGDEVNYAQLIIDPQNGFSFLNLGTGNGNVGIGTTNPTEKLSVNGKIRAQEIKVESANWPDFVFTKDYQFPSLRETENHIKLKGHLPGIPSAAEVAKDGIELGEMNKKLLQKIEELTLYLIDMKKEIDSLKKDKL